MSQHKEEAHAPGSRVSPGLLPLQGRLAGRCHLGSPTWLTKALHRARQDHYPHLASEDLGSEGSWCPSHVPSGQQQALEAPQDILHLLSPAEPRRTRAGTSPCLCPFLSPCGEKGECHPAFIQSLQGQKQARETGRVWGTPRGLTGQDERQSLGRRSTAHPPQLRHLARTMRRDGASSSDGHAASVCRLAVNDLPPLCPRSSVLTARRKQLCPHTVLRTVQYQELHVLYR